MHSRCSLSGRCAGCSWETNTVQPPHSPAMFLLLVKLRSCYGCLMGVEPLPDIRDGILVERLVKTVRYVADMRRGQDVFQRPEGVIRRQGLDVEHVERRASNAAVTQDLDERRLVNDRATRSIDEPGRWLHDLQLGRSNQALRPLAQNEVDRQDVGAAEEFLLGDEPRSACLCLVGREVLT